MCPICFGRAARSVRELAAVFVIGATNPTNVNGWYEYHQDYEGKPCLKRIGHEYYLWSQIADEEREWYITAECGHIFPANEWFGRTDDEPFGPYEAGGVWTGNVFVLPSPPP